MASTVQIGPFEVLSRIGKGGMGDVWLGVHREQEVEVALKVITPRRAREYQFTEALRREVEAVARLDHPGIVTVYDFGEVPASAERDSGRTFVAESPYLVMELVRGGSLLLQTTRSWRRIRSILLDLLDALAHAHARGVIHRDIKPGNVLLTEPDPNRHVQAKLTDFGLARALDDLGSGPDAMSSMSGTPRYMAPEQILGQWREQGPWTDLYALGCIAYYLLEGRPPFDSRKVEQVLESHLKTPVPPVGRRDVPEGFAEWLDRLLAKRPMDRFRHAADAMYALLQLPAVEPVDEDDASVSFSSGPLPTLASLKAALEADDDATTILQETRPENVSPGDAPLPDSAVPARPAAGTARRATAPPVPETWRSDQRTTPVELLGVGLGIFGLRAIPLVDRNPERDIVWEALLETSRSQTPHAVILKGEAGTGKSRLAEWIGDRASELGAATVMRAIHSPIQGPADGLGRMLAQHLRCVGLGRAETFERLRAFWLATGATAEQLFNCAALLDLMVGDDEELEEQELPRAKLTSPAQRYDAICDFLGRVAQERPLIVWLDDVQWGSEALELCQYVLERAESDLPVLFLLTARQDLLPHRPHERRQVEQVGQLPGVQSVQITPLERRYQSRLVSVLLGLDRSLAREVVDRTAGNPLFAVQLVGDWVERGLLEVGPEGFVLRPGCEPEIPDDIHLLWSRRLEHLLDVFSREQVEDALGALHVAAALGVDIDHAEWQKACRRAGYKAPRRLVSRMVSNRLAYREEAGWSFAHGMLRESLERSARNAGLWESLHAHCARALQDVYDGHEKNGRIADHLLSARQWEDALEPALSAAVAAFDVGDYTTTRQRLDQYYACCDALGYAEEHVQRAHAHVVEARLLRELGEPDAAYELLRRAEPVARQSGEPGLVASVVGSLASLAARQGDMESGQALAEEALSCYERAGDVPGQANTHRTLNWVKLWQGNFGEARPHIERARELFEQVGDEDGLGWVHYEMSIIAFERGEIDRADELNELAHRNFESVGNRIAIADCENMRGEIARYRGQLSEAEQHYRTALGYYEAALHANVTIARENLGLTLLAEGEYQPALDILNVVLDTNQRRGRRPDVFRIRSAVLACQAGLGDWRAWDETIEHLTRESETWNYSNVDIATNLELAAKLAAGAGDGARAGQAFRLSARQWERLDNPERARKLEQRIADGR